MNSWSVLKYFLVWQLIWIVISAASGLILPLQETYLARGTQTFLSNPLLYSRSNFDGDHYIRIAQSGYAFAEEAFFPLYPLLIKVVDPVVRNPVTAGVLISNVSFLVALIFLVKLMKNDGFSSQTIRNTLIILLIFPTSFFFGAVYTESMFLMWAVMAFYFARRGNWWLAGLFGALASFSRFVGVMLVPAFAIELFMQNRNRLISYNTLIKVLAICLVPMGLLVYMFYLDQTRSDPLAFFHVQKYYGQFRSDHPIMLPQVFWRYFKMITTVDIANPIYLNIMLESAVGILFLATSIYTFWKQRLSYAVFGALAYLFPTMTGSFVSLPRYVLVCFPSFILLARLVSKFPRWLVWVYYIVSIGSAVWLTILFARGYWVG